MLFRSGIALRVVPIGKWGGKQARGQVDVVSLTAVTRDTINANFHFGRVAEVRLVQVFGANCKRRKLWQRRRRPQTALLDILDLVVRDQVLCDAIDG